MDQDGSEGYPIDTEYRRALAILRLDEQRTRKRSWNFSKPTVKDPIIQTQWTVKQWNRFDEEGRIFQMQGPEEHEMIQAMRKEERAELNL